MSGEVPPAHGMAMAATTKLKSSRDFTAPETSFDFLHRMVYLVIMLDKVIPLNCVSSYTPSP